MPHFTSILSLSPDWIWDLWVLPLWRFGSLQKYRDNEIMIWKTAYYLEMIAFFYPRISILLFFACEEGAREEGEVTWKSMGRNRIYQSAFSYVTQMIISLVTCGCVSEDEACGHFVFLSVNFKCRNWVNLSQLTAISSLLNIFDHFYKVSPLYLQSL